MLVLIAAGSASIWRSVAMGIEADMHRVETALTSDDALDLAKSCQFDVVLVDADLPGSATRLVRELRRTRSPAPILVTSLEESVSEAVGFLDAGADDYVRRPFHIDELKARLRVLVRRREGRRENLIEVGDLTIDASSLCVRASGNVVSLSPREFQIVAILARAAGRPVAIDRLMEIMYAPDSSAIDRNVYVLIVRIRRKLRAGGARALIENVYGEGYMLSAERSTSVDRGARRTTAFEMSA